jgi:DNA helicase HerA-like ATPase
MTDIALGGVAEGTPVLRLALANRHGLIAGATGTGKTVTLQTLAEGFSRAGVPVFLADVKGDLAGIAKPATPGEKIKERVATLGLGDWQPRANAVIFWDLYGKLGHPVRATVTDMGPLLLSNLLELNDTQSGVLYACFKIADDQGLLLLDLKDLRALLQFASENAKTLQAEYGNIAAASVAAIQRALLVLEEQGADQFFGEPALALADLMQVDFSGQGVISVLDASALMPRPRLYATFLLWLLAELFEQLPEVGDADKPKLVFFFDEAHLLFDGAPKALIEKIEQVVRLIRSKGVGVYFVTQNPLDVPESVLGQLGNRVQHALRAFTPKDQKAVRVAAQTFRANPAFDTEKAITELGVGEALVSMLDAKGAPMPVTRMLIRPPQSRLGVLEPAERAEQLARSPLKGRYDTAVDRVSAYEKLKVRTQAAVDSAAQTDHKAKPEPRAPRQRETVVEAATKSAVRAISSSLGRQIVRGVLGSIFGGRAR